MTIMASETRDCAKRMANRLVPAVAGLRRAREVGEQRSEQPSGRLMLVLMLMLMLILVLEITLASNTPTLNAERPTSN